MNLRIPYIKQDLKGDNAHCGPCCIKMIADYFNCINPKTGKLYTIQSLVAKAQVCRKNGTTFNDMKRLIKEIGLRYRLIPAKSLPKTKNPVIACVGGYSGFSYHYVVIRGFDSNYEDGPAIIINDSIVGHNLRVSYKHKILSEKKPWLLEVKR